MWIPSILVGIIVVGCLFLNQTLMTWPTCGDHPNAICSMNRTTVVWDTGCYGQLDTPSSNLPPTFACCTMTCAGGRVFTPSDGANYRSHLYLAWRFPVNTVRLLVTLAVTNLFYRFWRLCRPYRLIYKPVVGVLWGPDTVTLQPGDNCVTKPCRLILVGMSVGIGTLSIIDPGYYAPIFLAVVSAICQFAVLYVWNLHPPTIKIRAKPLTHLLIEGIHPRLGKKSTLRAFFRENSLSEPQLLGIIGEFMAGCKGEFDVEVGSEHYRLPVSAFWFQYLGIFSDIRIQLSPLEPLIYVQIASWELERFRNFLNEESTVSQTRVLEVDQN